MTRDGDRFPVVIRRDSIAVRIYRYANPRTRSGYVYTVAWSVGGKRYLLQRATVAKARAEAAAKAEQLAAGKFAAARDITVDDTATLAAARRICGKTPVVAALEEWSRARTLSGGALLQAAKAWGEANRAAKPITVSEAVKLFINAKKRARVDVEASYQKVLPHLTERFDGPISAISARVLEDWVHQRFSVGGRMHPVTFNTCRKRLVALWRWLRKQGYLPRSVQTEAEQIDAMSEPDLDIGILTVADFARALLLMRDRHPGHLAATVLAGFCGLRRSELHKQRWSDVHLDRRFLKVTAAKRNTPAKRLVPLSGAAVEWLMLCDRKGELVSPPWALDRVRAFCRESDPPVLCPENGFRHSFVSYRVAATGNVAETALEAGNSPAIVFNHYRELVEKKEGAAWFALTPAKAAAMGTAVRIAEGA
jgi:integrase